MGGARKPVNRSGRSAQRQGYGFKRARDDQGFVIDGELDGRGWRMEWGPSHRAYIPGFELRLRMELGVPHDLQMLVLSRLLLESLERQAFEEFTDPVRTQIGANAPEEMRWLVMFPKVNLGALGSLKLRFGAVSSVPAVGLSWIEGHLAAALSAASKSWLGEDTPLALLTLRGRLYLRTAMAEPSPDIVAHALTLFLVAVNQSLRVAGGAADAPSAATSGATTAWQSLNSDPGRDPRS